MKILDMQLSIAKTFKNHSVRYFPVEEVVILRKIKAQLFVQCDSIGILDHTHPDLNKIHELWVKIRPQVLPGQEPDEVRFVQLDHDVSFFDQNNERMNDCTPFQSHGTYSLLLAIRGITKRVDADGKYKLIIRVKQAKIEEPVDDNKICHL